jgi:hypothetical protein
MCIAWPIWGKRAKTPNVVARRAGRNLCSGLCMSDWVDAPDHKPGNPPEVRRVGSSVVMVMPIEDGSTAHSGARLVLRLEPNGEVFAAISSSFDQAE